MEKQRKFYFVLPLLVIPFLTLGFIALGGGKTDKPQTAAKGIDTTLPQAQFSKQEKHDKLSVYQTVLRDSAQNGVSPSFLKAMGMKNPDSAKIAAVTNKPTADQNAERIQQKLAMLNKQLSQPQTQPQVYNPDEPNAQSIKRLQMMSRALKNTQQQEDPQMAQLSKMLTQIQQIQNPASVKKEVKPEDNTPFNAIPAIIDGKQKVMNGGAVKLKLTDSVTLKNQTLPKGQELFGVCSVTNQRLLLTIQNIRLNEQIIPVNLTVFSLDGMPGIPAPEAQISGAASGGANDAIQNMQFLSMDASLGAQAAAGGVNAAKGLFSKKVHQIKVKLKDQYPVLLKINH